VVKKYDASLLYYLRTIVSDGLDAWFIAGFSSKMKLELLKRKIADNQPYDLREYAEILYAGHEKEAPQELLDDVNREYGTCF